MASTFFDALHPVFITSADVTDKVIDDLLQTSADNYLNAEEWDCNFSFSVQRKKSDAAREIARVAAGGHPMQGTLPPVGPNSTLDFEGASIDELAEYVLCNFGSDEGEFVDGQFVQTISLEERSKQRALPHIDTQFFVILDEQSARDRSMIVVEIPSQEGAEDDAGQITRKWTKRDRYDNPPTDDEADVWTEMIAARVVFEEGFRVAMCQMGEEGVVDYCEIAREYGAYSQQNADLKYPTLSEGDESDNEAVGEATEATSN